MFFCYLSSLLSTLFRGSDEIQDPYYFPNPTKSEFIPLFKMCSFKYMQKGLVMSKNSQTHCTQIHLLVTLCHNCFVILLSINHPPIIIYLFLHHLRVCHIHTLNFFSMKCCIMNFLNSIQDAISTDDSKLQSDSADQTMNGKSFECYLTFTVFMLSTYICTQTIYKSRFIKRPLSLSIK